MFARWRRGCSRRFRRSRRECSLGRKHLLPCGGSRDSELCFVNNSELENLSPGSTAKYQKPFDIELYGFAIESNHLQFPVYVKDL